MVERLFMFLEVKKLFWVLESVVERVVKSWRGGGGMDDIYVRVESEVRKISRLCVLVLAVSL